MKQERPVISSRSQNRGEQGENLLEGTVSQTGRPRAGRDMYVAKSMYV
jgi:hypothetical protein